MGDASSGRCRYCAHWSAVIPGESGTEPVTQDCLWYNYCIKNMITCVTLKGLPKNAAPRTKGNWSCDQFEERSNDG